MGKKKFENMPYDPLQADFLRDVAKVGREVEPKVETAQAVPTKPIIVLPERAPTPSTHNVVELPLGGPERRLPRRAKEPEAAEPRQRSAKFIAKRFELTRDEDIDFGSFLARIQRASGVRVPVSVLIRACCTLLQQGEKNLIAQLQRGPFRKMPATDDDIGYAEFEERWVELVRLAIPRTSREASQGLS